MTTKTLTQAQINAICKKLKRDFNPEKVMSGMSEREMEKENTKYLTKVIKGIKMPAPLKKFLLADVDMITDCITKKELKALGVPHLNPHEDATNEYKIRRKHDEMLEDLKFELTMATATDYKKHMDAFQAKVKKALSK